MSFDKKWSQLSQEEQRAAKAEHGSRSAWQDARARSQGYQSKADKDAGKSNNTGSTGSNGSSTAYTNTKDGKVEAPSWYRNSDGSTPSTMQKGLTQERWEQQNAAARAKQEKRDAERAAAKANDFNRNQRDAKREEAYAYKDSRAAIQEHMDAAGRRGVYEYQSAKDLQESKGGLAYNSDDSMTDTQKERNALIRTFRDSGYDYNHADILRHMKGGAENKMFTGLYDDYGGYENWYSNHSIYSGENAQATDHVTNSDSRLLGDSFDADYNLNLGNWTGSKDIMERNEVLRQGQARQQAGQNYRTSEDYLKRFGQYDWA